MVRKSAPRQSALKKPAPKKPKKKPSRNSAEPLLGGPFAGDGQLSELAKATGYMVDRIILGPTPSHGLRFEVFSFDCAAVPGTTPTVCPHADRKPQPEWLPQIERRFRDLGLVGAGQTIHWVGSQSEVGSVCGCFHPDGANGAGAGDGWSDAKSPKEWCKLLDISATTFRRWRSDGTIRSEAVTKQRVKIQRADLMRLSTTAE